MPPVPDTRTALLDLAQELAQTRGFGGFSFHDLARGVGIRTASVHHHFATKEELGRELMERYRRAFGDELRGIDERASCPRRKLQAFAGLFRKTLRSGDRLCLCGMLASEFANLPSSVQREVRLFYDETESWLARVLGAGQEAGTLALEGSAAAVARTILATLEGAMIAARAFGDERRLERAASWLLSSVERPPPAGSGG